MKHILKVLLFAVAIVNFARGDDVADNALEDGEEIYLEDEVGEGQVDNMNVETADDDAEKETATYDIEHEGKDVKSSHLHITFRKKYLAKNTSSEH